MRAAQNIQVILMLKIPLSYFSVLLSYKKTRRVSPTFTKPHFHMVGTAGSLRTSTVPEGNPPRAGEACSREPSLGSSFDSVEFQK
jgi:hypothetical protein